jgi:lipoprotein-anchoring transpeptidase ErfK/SrfK
MRVRKLVIGAALTAIGLLSACSSPAPANVDLAAGSGNIPVTTAPSNVPTTSQQASSTPAPPTTVPPPPASNPPATSKKPAPPKTTTPKPKPKPSTEAPCSTAAKACIKLSTNQSWLMEDGKVTYGPVPITHGRAGYLTPPGTFKVTFKNKDHKSSIFNNAPMPYSVFFNGGIAFHQGSLKEKSHGCIHLSMAAAKQFFGALSVGEIVEVVR